MLNRIWKTRRRHSSTRSGHRRDSAASRRSRTTRLLVENLEERRLLAAGALDPSFGGDGRVLTDVASQSSTDIAQGGVVYQSDGKAVVVGQTYGFLSERFLAAVRYNADGTRDTTFGNNGDGKLRINVGFVHNFSAFGVRVAVDSQDRLLIAGTVGEPGDDLDFGVVRFTPDGAMDTSFGSDGRQSFDFGSRSEFSNAVAVDSLDRVLIAGRSFQESTGNDFAVARLTETGELDNSFDGDGRLTVDFDMGDDSASGVAVDSLDRVIVAGNSVISPTDNDWNIEVIRLTTSGSFDPNFDGDGRQSIDLNSRQEFAEDVAVDGLDRVVVAGYTASSSSSDFVVRRLTSDGMLDTDFAGDGKQIIDFDSTTEFPSIDIANSVAVDSLNRVIVAGSSSRGVRFREAFAVARLTEGGDLDAEFNGNGTQTIDFTGETIGDVAQGVAVDSADQILLAGTSEQSLINGQDFAVARLTATGALDNQFGEDGRVTTELLRFSPGDGGQGLATQQSNGKVVVVGGAIAVRYEQDGTVDLTFGTDGVARLPRFLFDGGFSFAVDSLDRIIIGGFGSAAVTQSDFIVARLMPDGQLDASFGVDGTQRVDFGNTRDFGRSVAVDSLNRVVIAGDSIDNSTGWGKFAVARLTENGQTDPDFGDGGKQIIDFGFRSDRATRVAVDSQDGVVLAGVSNQELTGDDFAVARLTENGELDNSFSGDGRHTVDFGEREYGNGLALDRSDRVIVGGALRTSGVFGVARFLQDGTLDESFDGDGRQTLDFGGTSAFVNAVAVDSTDRVLVAGHTNQQSTGRDFAVARLLVSGALDTSFDGDGKQTVDFGSQSDLAFGVAVDHRGRVLLAGTSNQGYPSFNDIAVARLLSNEPPVADAGGPYWVAEGSSIQLDASGTTDSSQSTHSLIYEWDLDGDSVFGESGADAARGDETGVSPFFDATGLDGPNTVAIELRVTDQGNLVDFDSTAVNIVNVAPTLAAAHTAVVVNEGDTAVNIGTVSDAGADVVTLSASIGAVVDNGDGTWGWSWSSSDGPDDSQAVTITATDADGDITSIDFDLVVNNLAPLVTLVGPTVADEGQTLSYSFTTVDPGADTFELLAINVGPDALVSNESFDAVTGSGSFDVTFLDGPNTASVMVQLEDSDGAYSNASTIDVTVSNVAPELLNITPSMVGEDRTVNLSGRFSDAGALDTHTILIDWGEIDDSAVNADEDRTILDLVAADSREFSVDHNYSSGGVFTITVSVIDDDLGEVSDLTKVRVSGVRLDPSTNQLQVIGTDENDYGTIARFGDELIVAADFLPKSHWWLPFGIESFPSDHVTSILVETRGGDDAFAVLRNVTQPSNLNGGAGNDFLTGRGGPSSVFGGAGNDILIGGPGNDILNGEAGNDRILGSDGDDRLLGGEGDDHLDGGRGNDILVGGSGDDHLNGDRGRDLLFGGLGADDLKGGKGDDLLIAGWTTYDDDQSALETIREVWQRDQSYEERITALRAGVEMNDGSIVILNDQGENATVFDDEEVDRLKGQQGSDWFFADLANDRLVGQRRWEQIG